MPFLMENIKLFLGHIGGVINGLLTKNPENYKIQCKGHLWLVSIYNKMRNEYHTHS